MTLSHHGGPAATETTRETWQEFGVSVADGLKYLEVVKV